MRPAYDIRHCARGGRAQALVSKQEVEVEAKCLSPVLHHQLLHARVGQAYRQEQLSKLLTVLKQVHHDAQQLLLVTGLQERTHAWRAGAPVKEAGKRLCAAMARSKHI